MSNAVLGSLEIQMMADLVRFRRDMGDAKGIVNDAMTSIQGMVKSAMGGLVAGLGVAAFGAWIKGAIDAADNMNDLSKSTGLTVEKLSGLKLAAAQSGTTLEGIAQGINKLAVNMGKDAEKFAKLGITAKDPLEAFKQLSNVFVAIKDPMLRNAMAAEAIGKSWQTAAPALAEGGDKLGKLIERGESMALVTQDMANQADLFNDQVEELKAVSGGLALEMAQSLLPTLNAIAGAFRDVGTDSRGSKKETGLFTSILKTALETAAVVALNVGYTFRAIGGEIATWGRQIKAFATRNFAEGIKIGVEWTAKSAEMRAEVDRQSDAILGVRTQMEGHSEATEENAARTVASTQAVMNFVGANKESAAAAIKAAAEQARLTKAGQDYLISLNEQYGALQQEISLGRALTDGEKEQIKLTELLAKGKMALTAEEEASARVKLAEMDATRQQRAAAEDYLKTLAAVAQHSSKWNDEQTKTTETLRAGNVALIEENAKLGMSDTAWAARQRAVLLSQAADLEWQAANEGGNFQLEEQARLLRERAQLSADGVVLKEAKAAADEWKKTTESIQNGLTDALMRAFESGKGFLDAFKDTLLNAFRTLILQPMVKSMVGQLSGGLQSVMGMLGTSGSGATVGGDMGGIKGNNAGAAAGAAGMAGSSWIPYVGWAMAAIGQASTDYDKGWTAQAAGRDGRNLNTAINPFAGFFRSAISNDKWASVLSGDTAMARLFGRKAPETTAQGISGSFGGAGFTGQAFQDWHAEGGLFRSDKNGTNTAALDAALGAELTGTSQAMLQHIKDYATALALPVTALAGVTTTARIELGDDAAKNKVAIDAALSTYGAALVKGYESQLAAFGTVGESAIDTLNRLGGSLTSVNGVFQTLGLHLADTSLAGGQAASELIALTGGLDAFMSKTQAYLGAYYSQGEQSGISAKAIIQTLSAAGIDAAAFNDRGDLRGLMDSLDPNATGGRSQMAALLNVSADFAKLTDYLAETGQTLGDLAAQAPQSPLGGTMGIDPVEQSNALLQTANDNLASIAAATQANTTELQALVAVQSAGTQSLIDRLREIADGLTNAMRPGYLAEMAQE